jgi:4-aminobutyrate aminotransferase-like enzyme
VGLELLTRDGAPATDWSLAVTQRLLARGFIILPEGPAAHVLGFTPPLTITVRQLERAVRALDAALRETAR